MATLDQVEATLFQGLSAMKGPGPGKFVTVGEWVGPPPQARNLEVTRETFGKAPAALLAFEFERDQTDIATLAQQFEFCAQSYWTVLVCVSDPRGARATLKASAGMSGALALCSAVIAALNGLQVPAPAAVITLAVTGTPNAVVTLTGFVVQYVAASGETITYTPNVPSITLGGGGLGSFAATCTGPAGDLGNAPIEATMTWSPCVPVGLSGAMVVSGLTPGDSGLIRVDVISYEGTRVVARSHGTLLVMGVRFTAKRAAEQAPAEDTTTPYQGTTFNEHLTEVPATSGLPFPDPFETGKDR